MFNLKIKSDFFFSAAKVVVYYVGMMLTFNVLYFQYNADSRVRDH